MIRLGPLSFQPAELAKVATIMMFGRTLEDITGSINDWKLLYHGIYAIVPCHIHNNPQPDMGMTMVLFFMVVGIFFIAGLDIRFFIGGFSALALAIILILNFNIMSSLSKEEINIFLKSRSWYVGNQDIT